MRTKLVMAVLLAAIGCVGDKRTEPKAEPAAPVAKQDPIEERCVAWGVAHYKQIGSYPTLTDGTKAEDEARAKCKRAIDAYPNPLIAETERAIVELESTILTSDAKKAVDAAEAEYSKAQKITDIEKWKVAVAEAGQKRDEARAKLAALFDESKALRAKLARLRAEEK